jgi:predicted acylesterase/phospholipase RssA
MINPSDKMKVLNQNDPESKVLKDPSSTHPNRLIIDTKNNQSQRLRVRPANIAEARKNRNSKINKTFTNLAFEGGGVKGFAYTGALFFLQEYDILPQIKNVSGSSVGSLLALLVSLGLDAYEIFVEMLKADFNKFADDSFGIVRDMERFYKKFGIFKGEALFKAVEDILEKYTGNKNITFKQLFEKT